MGNLTLGSAHSPRGLLGSSNRPGGQHGFCTRFGVLTKAFWLRATDIPHAGAPLYVICHSQTTPAGKLKVVVSVLDVFKVSVIDAANAAEVAPVTEADP